MKLANSLALSLTVALIVLLLPQPGSAQGSAAQSADPPMVSAAANSNQNLASEREVAQQLVPAEVELTRTLDAKIDKVGSTFEARLDGAVHLKNGTELPSGTVLVGQVATDRMRNEGTSRLSLQFTEAKLKDGKAIPVEATIVGIAGPAGLSGEGLGTEGPLAWDGTSLQYDDVGVMSHVDLHSRIGGANSGALLANNRRDMKLVANSRMSLALGERGSS